MNKNILPLRKAEKFYLCKAEIDSFGVILEKERVGIAFQAPGSRTMRLRLAMFPQSNFFLAREPEDNQSYSVLCLEEYEANGIKRKLWHKVGQGQLLQGFIRIKFQLFNDDIYLCLFPDQNKEADHAA